MKKLSVFGLGYVGCVSAACMAAAGYDVIGVDISRDKVKMINKGVSPIVEPGLEELLQRVVSDNKLRATTSCREAVMDSFVAFVCVGTPGDGNGQLQLDALKRVCTEIGQALRGATPRIYTVIIRSTVLPGTVRNIVHNTLLAAAGDEYRSCLRVAVNPEFIREGTALKDFRNPPFTLAGTDDSATTLLLRSIYATIDAPFVPTTIENAEAVKYVCNAFHALKVCFANEVGDACAAFGIDASEIMKIVCMDHKLNISDAYLRPGFAFGGSCLPKDIKALLYAAQHRDVSLPLLNAILPSNNAQIQHGITAVLNTGKRRIGVAGLSFKSNTDDLRESPLVLLVEALIGKGCDVRIFDRNVSVARLTGANRRYIEEEIPHIATLMCDTPSSLLEHAQVIVIGNDGADAKRIIDSARADQTIIDLTRSTHKHKPGSKSRVAA